jgi:hypothetical protein
VASLFHYRPAIQRVLDRFPVAAAAEVIDKIENGDAQLFALGHDNVAVTRLVQEPARLVCLIWLSSGDLDALLVIHDDIEAWARDQGCSHLKIVGRKGWLKVLDGYRETAVEMEKEIGDG